jgi:hypothetical protein
VHRERIVHAHLLKPAARAHVPELLVQQHPVHKGLGPGSGIAALGVHKAGGTGSQRIAAGQLRKAALGPGKPADRARQHIHQAAQQAARAAGGRAVQPVPAAHETVYPDVNCPAENMG